MSIDELKSEIEKLDARSFSELRFWMNTLDDDEADRKLRAAAEAGYFDEMAEEARQSYERGETRPLPTEDDLVETPNRA